MRQIIVAASDKNRVEDIFSERGFHVTWCPFLVEELMRVRDCSDVIFLRITDEDEDELKRIGLYLRDLCIEEEKLVYLYGNRVGVDIVRARIPTLYVRAAAYAFASALNILLDDLSELKRKTDMDAGIRCPRVLIIDDDISYIAKLRLYLDSQFEVYVCHNDIAEAGSMILYSDILVIGTGGHFTVAEYMELSDAILRRKRSPHFHLYYLASDDEERVRLGGGDSGIILSKETEVSRVADYLAKKKVYSKRN